MFDLCCYYTSLYSIAFPNTLVRFLSLQIDYRFPGAYAVYGRYEAFSVNKIFHFKYMKLSKNCVWIYTLYSVDVILLCHQ